MARRCRKRAPYPGRALHLVDLENLVGGGFATSEAVIAILREYFELSGWRPGDIVVIAGHERLLLKFALRNEVACRIHAARGPDGADLALLRHADPDFVARRFWRLVVGSGDGIFADLLEASESGGVEVLVVSRRESLSHLLARFPHRAIRAPEVLEVVA